EDEGLLGMESIARLLDDDALRAVDDLRGDFIATVSRQAVEESGVWVGFAHESRVDLVRLKISPAGNFFGLLTHACPHIGVHDVRASDRLGRVDLVMHSRATV